MTIDWGSTETGNCITLCTAVLLLAGLIAALCQLCSIRKANRSEAYSSITSDLHALDKLMIDHPELELLLDTEVPKEDKGEFTRQRWLVLWYLDLYENVHFQMKKGIIPQKLHKGWEEEMRSTFQRLGVQKQYQCLGYRYNEDFRKFIEGLRESDL